MPAFFIVSALRRDFRVGAVLREQNALPYEVWIMKNLTAKDDVDNVGAGRAAKGAKRIVRRRTIRTQTTFKKFLFCH